MRISPPPAQGQTEQELLDGLPIAAAKLGGAPGQPVRIELANDNFRRLAGHDERLRGRLAADVALLSRGPIATALRAFLDGGESAHQFDVEQGGRCLVVRFSRLSGENRCLFTLIDSTAELGPERSFRTEPSRDRLTGLPSASAFLERVAELTEHPNFQPGSHAVLTVALTGAELGDELVLAAARRLLSALRAGDLLARTGQDEFRILMRVDRGLSDADELAERLTAALSAPYRLSTTELCTGCAVECEPLG